jgi:hypothetical protein
MPDDVELTEAMIEAGYTTACNYPAVALHASHNETRSMVETVYRAMHAARTPVSVEEVARALVAEIKRQTDGYWPLEGEVDNGLVDAHLDFVALAEAAIAALSTRP